MSEKICTTVVEVRDSTHGNNLRLLCLYFLLLSSNGSFKLFLPLHSKILGRNGYMKVVGGVPPLTFRSRGLSEIDMLCNPTRGWMLDACAS